MTSLRGLLKLEDKLAAEERRLETLGGPSNAHLLPLIVVAVVAAHVLLLLLPTLRAPGRLPASSPQQDYPMVWRPGLASSPDPEPPLSEPGPEPAEPLAGVADLHAASRPWVEPVPETSRALTGAMVRAEVEALIPPPDAPPPSFEPGATLPVAPSRSARLTLIRRVQPEYPAGARSLRVDARVTVQLVVSADGSVADASVLGSTRIGLGFEAAALEAVQQWRYEPRDSGAAPRAIVVTIDFKGQGPPR